MKQTYNIPRSLEQGIVANNAAIASLKNMSYSLKSLAENVSKLHQIVKEHSTDDNQKRLSLSKDRL